mgnify:CR=1 FL=1
MTREEKIKALEDLGVYYKWRVNCKSKREDPDSSLETREKRVESYLDYEGYTTSEIVDQAFIWQDTPEGEEYWSKIYNELVENEDENEDESD